MAGVKFTRSSTAMDGMAKLADVFFNGRPAEPESKPATVTIHELIRRKKSIVKVGNKLYRVTVEEAEVK